MKLIKIASFLAIFLSSSYALSGHHEKAAAMLPAATSGQLIVMYHWPCADIDKGMGLLKKMIAYERQHSPVPYSATPALHEDGALVSVDIHASAESLKKAEAWQNADEQWQAGFSEMVEACGSADDLSMSVLSVQ